MQILDDIWKSITGNLKTRVTDPFLGSFITSWALCNWDKLALLFFGKGTVNERVSAFSEKLALINNPSLFINDVDLIIMPLLISLFYIFVLPILSLWIRGKQKTNIIKQYNQVVTIDIEKANDQKNLNKINLRSDPNKEFLGKEVELDLKLEEDRITRRNGLTTYILSRSESKKKELELVNLKLEEKNKSIDALRIESERKIRIEDKEKMKHLESIAIHNAVIASNNYPTSYGLLDSLARSLEGDSVILSLSGLSDCIAAIFGYENYASLINDKDFNNERAKQCVYIYHDSDYLRKRLDIVIEKELVENEDLSSELLFDHISTVLEEAGYIFSSEDSIVENISDKLSENSYELLDEDLINSAMAETDTTFDEVDIDIQNATFENGLRVNFGGSASGTHRRESDIRRQDISFRGVATCVPVLGRYGLSDHSIEIRQAGPVY